MDKCAKCAFLRVVGGADYIYIYMYIWVWIKTPCCRGALPLCYKPLSQGLCYKPLRTSVQSTVVFKGLVAGGFVADHPRLLQTLVAKWPPKPVTRPMFLIRCHIKIYIYIYMYTYVHIACYILHVAHFSQAAISDERMPNVRAMAADLVLSTSHNSNR